VVGKENKKQMDTHQTLIAVRTFWRHKTRHCKTEIPKQKHFQLQE
jgi:hypothetical protein